MWSNGRSTGTGVLLSHLDEDYISPGFTSHGSGLVKEGSCWFNLPWINKFQSLCWFMVRFRTYNLQKKNIDISASTVIVQGLESYYISNHPLVRFFTLFRFFNLYRFYFIYLVETFYMDSKNIQS